MILKGRIMSNQDYTPNTPPNRSRRTVTSIFLAFVLLMLIGSAGQSIPVNVVTYVLIFPESMELVEQMLNGAITQQQYLTSLAELVLDATAHPAAVLANLFGTGAIIAACLVYHCAIKKNSPSTLGIRKQNAFCHYIIGLLFGFMLFSGALAVVIFSGAGSIALAKNANYLYIVLFFLGFLVQGFEEELLLRGFLFGQLKGVTSRSWAVFISSLFFSLLHVGNPGVNFTAILNLTLFGIFAAMYYQRTQSIWGVSALHSMWNFTQGNIWGVPVSGLNVGGGIFTFTPATGREVTNGGLFGLEGGLAVTVVLMIGIFMLFWTSLPKSPRATIIQD